MEEENENNKRTTTTLPSSDCPDRGINDSNLSPDDPNSTTTTTANSTPSILLLDVRQQVTVDALGHRGVYTGQIHVNGDRPNNRGLPSGQGEMMYQHGRTAGENNIVEHEASGTAAESAMNDNDDDLPASYKGAFVDGYWHGQGRQELRNGDVFVGEFQKSRRVFGEYRWNAQEAPAATTTAAAKTGTTTQVIKQRMYQGAFQNDRPHGHGKYTWKTITKTLSDDNGNDENNDKITSTSSYVGMFEYGQRQGHGIYSSPVLEYTGDWMQGKYHGYGVLVYKTADGRTMSTYRGNFANGKREGKGVLVLNDGIVVHDGLWKGDKPSSTEKEGQGQAQDGTESKILDRAPALTESPSKAETSFASSLWGGIEALASSFSAPFSEGTNTTPQASVKLTKSAPTASSSSTYNKSCKAVVDIDVLDGQDNPGRYTGIIHIESQRPHGVGRMVYSDGNRVSEGFWVNGSREGHGRCLFVKTGDYYEGEFQDNLRHGKGRYVWKDGKRFEGTYVMDERHGEGVFSYPNGDCFTGSFERGTRAFGVFKSKQSTFRGEWKNNTYHGQGELRWDEGDGEHLYKGSFVQGHFDGEGIEAVKGEVKHQGQWRKGTFYQQSETPAASASFNCDEEVSQDDSDAEAVRRVPSTGECASTEEQTYEAKRLNWKRSLEPPNINLQ